MLLVSIQRLDFMFVFLRLFLFQHPPVAPQEPFRLYREYFRNHEKGSLSKCNNTNINDTKPTKMRLGSWHKTTAFGLLDFAISQKSLTFCSATGKPNFWQEKQVGQSFLLPLLLPHAFLQNLRKNPTSSLSQQLDKKRIRLLSCIFFCCDSKFSALQKSHQELIHSDLYILLM